MQQPTTSQADKAILQAATRFKARETSGSRERAPGERTAGHANLNTRASGKNSNLNTGGKSASRKIQKSNQKHSINHQSLSQDVQILDSKNTSGLQDASHSSAAKSASAKVVHDAIIDLYLQVKIRSNDEIDMFETEQFSNERDRLSKLDSLTVLDYIKTSIEILMQMKLEEEKGEGEKKDRDKALSRLIGQTSGDNTVAPSEFTSTFQSLDLPPKEYEQQLQQYEAEVRNHIKVEQQLKLHIEVLQEKIDDLEKEKDNFEKTLSVEKASHEKKLKEGFSKLLEQKQTEVEKLQKEVKRQRDLANASLERGRPEKGSHHSTSQVKVVRVNNFVGSGAAGSKGNNRAIASSHSPSGLGAGRNKDQTGTKKIKKGLKVVGQVGKSPYLNDCFNKRGVAQTSTSTNARDSSTSSSAKANRQGAASAEISESSLIVLKKSNKSQANNTNNVQTINNSSLKPVDNKKLLAAIQRIRQVNPSSQSQIQSKNSTSVTNTNGAKIVNLSSYQIHKKNAKSQNTNTGSKSSTNATSQQYQQTEEQKAQSHYRSIGTSDTNTNPQLSEQSQQLPNNQPSQRAQNIKVHHNSIVDSTTSGAAKMGLTQTNLGGSGNLNSSLKKGKPGIRTSVTRVTKDHDKAHGTTSTSSKRVIASRKSQNQKEVANILSRKIVEVEHKGLSTKITPGGVSSASNAHHIRKSKPKQDSQHILNQSQNAIVDNNSGLMAQMLNEADVSQQIQQQVSGQHSFENESQIIGQNAVNMIASNEQDFISQFQHSAHGYQHQGTSGSVSSQYHQNQINMSQISQHSHQNVSGSSVGQHGSHHQATKLKNPSVQYSGSRPTQIQQPINQQKNPGFQQSEQVVAMKNYRKTAIASRTRPRSQTGHQNQKPQML